MTRYIRWQLLVILLGVVLVGVLLAYLAFNYTTVLRPGYGGTYVEGIVGFPRHLNPLLSGYNEVDRDVCSLVFSGLTRMNERGEVEADLARGWDVTLDGLTYTFYLRSNAYWHDGVPLTSDDVVFTISLLQDPDFPGPPELGSTLWQRVEVKKVDPRTVRFTLPEPYAPFLDYTTFGILPAHMLAGIHAADLPDVKFNLKPVGSGPFQVEEVEIKDGTVTSMVLKQFPRYYKAQAYLDKVQFRFYPSHQMLLDAYEAGDVEGIAQVLPEDLERAYDFNDLNLFSSHVAEYSLVFLNLDRSDLPFFQETEVRQALLYALDRQLIIDKAMEGQGLIAHSPIIPGTWAYEYSILHYGYAPDHAEDLMDEAGWILPEDGDGSREKEGQKLAFTLTTSNDPDRVEVAEMIVQQWAAVGISTTLEVVSPLELRDVLENHDFDAGLVHLMLPGDPDPYPFWHEKQIDKGQNYAGLSHRRISEALEQARVTISRERRRELYEEFQEIFAQEVPALLLYVPIYTYGVDDDVKSVQIGPLMYPSDRFRTISSWWIVHRRVFVSEAEAR